MLKTEQIVECARKVLKEGSVIISAANIQDGVLERLQVYFWSEHEAVMDVIEKSDLVENWPDEGVFLLNLSAEKESEALLPVRIVDGEEDFYIRSSPEDEDQDDLGCLPTVEFMAAIEGISCLRDKIKL